MTRNRLALVDRDGTINVEQDHLTRPEEVELLPNAAEGIRILTGLGLGVVVVSNQSVVGRGWLKREELDLVHEQISALLREKGAAVEAFFVCPHRPDEVCVCRKPAPGLALEAARRFDADLARSFVIGDQATDMGLGRAVGATTILVETGYGLRLAPEAASWVDRRATDLVDAAQIIRSLVSDQ